VQVTPLLVKLYVDKAVQVRQAGDSLDTLPESIPETYYEFLRAVNPQGHDAENYLTNEDMFRAAELLGKLSLGQDFVPKEFAKSKARDLLKSQAASFGQNDPIKRLTDNNVLREAQAGSDMLLRFVLDPIAEFLAAMAWAKECGTDESQWTELCHRVNGQSQPAPEFRQVLRIVWRTYGDRFGWPDVNGASRTDNERTHVSQ
jgi:hypothetical protein